MGNSLFKAVTELTGLPETQIANELTRIVRGSGSNPESLTLEELRAAMLAYLESCFIVEDGTEKDDAGGSAEPAEANEESGDNTSQRFN